MESNTDIEDAPAPTRRRLSDFERDMAERNGESVEDFRARMDRVTERGHSDDPDLDAAYAAEYANYWRNQVLVGTAEEQQQQIDAANAKLACDVDRRRTVESMGDPMLLLMVEEADSAIAEGCRLMFRGERDRASQMHERACDLRAGIAQRRAELRAAANSRRNVVLVGAGVSRPAQAQSYARARREEARTLLSGSWAHNTTIRPALTMDIDVTFLPERGRNEPQSVASPWTLTTREPARQSAYQAGQLVRLVKWFAQSLHRLPDSDRPSSWEIEVSLAGRYATANAEAEDLQNIAGVREARERCAQADVLARTALERELHARRATAASIVTERVSQSIWRTAPPPPLTATRLLAPSPVDHDAANSGAHDRRAA